MAVVDEWSIWRRFMVTAHQSLAVRDFDWLLPDPVVETQPDPRNGFYETLAAVAVSVILGLGIRFASGLCIRRAVSTRHNTYVSYTNNP